MPAIEQKPPEHTWALRMRRDGLLHAGALRLRNIEVCVIGDALWLRGSDLAQELRAILQALPAVERFDIATGGMLVPAGKSVPVARVPDGPWMLIAAALRLEAQTAQMPATVTGLVDLRLERCDVVREPNVLIADADAWRAFAFSASTLRLRALRFALSETRALIWGAPTPSISGTRCVESGGIAVPAGFALAPIADPEVLCSALGLKSGDIAVFSEDGSYELIEADLFVPATRSAVRLPK